LARAIELLIVCYDRIRVHQTNVDLVEAFEPETGPKYRALRDNALTDRDRALTDLAAQLAAWRQ
jgi:hypothetical protein